MVKALLALMLPLSILALPEAVAERSESAASRPSAAGAACSKAAGTKTSNPSTRVFPEDFADPCIIYVNGKYYVFSNNSHINESDMNLPMASSADFAIGWERSDATGVLSNAGNWTVQSASPTPSLWAPDVQQISNDHFVMYYAAVAKTPHALTHIVPLSKDGLSLAGKSQFLLNSTTAEYDAEGPAMTASEDGKTFFLWIVTGYFKKPSYSINYLTAASPYGPFHNINPKVLLNTGVHNGVYTLSPGALDFINRTHMVLMTNQHGSGCEESDPLVRKCGLLS